MSVHYIHAMPGKQFIPTKLGETEARIYAKYNKSYQNPQYKTIVPQSWLTKGWVEEVDIEGEDKNGRR